MLAVALAPRAASSRTRHHRHTRHTIITIITNHQTQDNQFYTTVNHTIPHFVVDFVSLSPPIRGTTQIPSLLSPPSFLTPYLSRAINIFGKFSYYHYFDFCPFYTHQTNLLSILVAPPPSATSLQQSHDETLGGEQWEKCQHSIR